MNHYNEFELIEHFFAPVKKCRRDVRLGIGDDCALLQVPPGQSLAVSMDTLVAGVHFPEDTAPYDIGYKALAVNLSDLAAMGAAPAWVTLALTLPVADEKWLKQFCRGFFSLIKRYKLQLVGGDMTHGPLAMTVQVHGFVPFELTLRRDQAKVGDLIYVTGTLGDAGAALEQIFKNLGDENVEKHDLSYLLHRFNRPEPRIEVGLALRSIAHCAIDISDGLAPDLGHILRASEVGAKIYIEDLPLSVPLKENFSKQKAWGYALNSGDDYELCFTISPSQEVQLKKVFKTIDCKYTRIGMIEKKTGLRLKHRNGRACKIAMKGYRHF